MPKNLTPEKVDLMDAYSKQLHVCVNIIMYKKIKNTLHLKRRNIGIANMHKKYTRQDRDPGLLDHVLAR